MDIVDIEQAIKRIEENSEKEYQETFNRVSNGRLIKRTDEERYEKLLEQLEYHREYQAFYQENEEIINRFLYLRRRADDNAEIKDISGIDEIEKEIKEIEHTSEEANRGRFLRASNGKLILKDQEDKYELLLEKLAYNKEYADFFQNNEDVINRYIHLKELADTNSDTKSSEKTSISTIDVPSKTEIIVKEETKETEPEQKIEVVAKEVPSEDIKESSESSEIKPVQSSEGISLKKDGIIQDLPINDKSEQVFNTPGMTDAEIKASQEKLASVPEAKKYVPEPPSFEEFDRVTPSSPVSEDKPVIDINANQPVNTSSIPTPPDFVGVNSNTQNTNPGIPTPPEFTSVNMESPVNNGAAMANMSSTPTQEPVASSPAENVSSMSNPAPAVNENVSQQAPEAIFEDKKKKVTKRQRYTWKDKITAKFQQLKGIIFMESMTGKSRDYMNICLDIENARGKYKNRTNEENEQALASIDQKIASTPSVSYDEKRRLYKKLAKLAKKVGSQKYATVIDEQVNANNSIVR